MPAGSSSPGPPGPAQSPHEPSPVHIITFYETSSQAPDTDPDHPPLTEQLRLGPLTPYYQRFAAQLPHVLANEPLDPTRASFHRWRGPLTDSRLWRFGMPSGQVVVGLAVQVTADLSGIGDLIEDCAGGALTFGGRGIAELAAGQPDGDRVRLTGERHQLVLAESVPADSRNVIGRLVARASTGYWSEPGPASYPAQLNRRTGVAAAITPYATVLCGQPEYVAHAALTVAAQALANVARLHEIHTALYHDLRLFWAIDHACHGTRSRREALERLTHQLARLELDLAVAVEAPMDLSALVPSGLVREYQDHLYSQLDIPVLANNSSRMLRRLEATGRAELDSVAHIERRADEDRHQRWAVGVGFVSAVAVPLSLILGFFSADVAEIDGARSMFDAEYLWVYGAVALLLLVAVAIGVGTFVVQRRDRGNVP